MASVAPAWFYHDLCQKNGKHAGLIQLHVRMIRRIQHPASCLLMKVVQVLRRGELWVYCGANYAHRNQQMNRIWMKINECGSIWIHQAFVISYRFGPTCAQLEMQLVHLALTTKKKKRQSIAFKCSSEFLNNAIKIYCLAFTVRRCSKSISWCLMFLF